MKKANLKKFQKKSLMIAVFMAVVLSGCAARSTTSDSTESVMTKEAVSEYVNTDDIYNADASMASTQEMQDTGSTGSGDIQSEVTESSALSDRKLIKNVDMDVETEEFDSLLLNLQNKIDSLNGYVENLSTGEDSGYYGNENANRYASVTARIPADQVDQFVTAVDSISNVIRKNENVSDVTLQYVDLESHKKALQVEEKRLLELLENAENVTDIISIETRLSDVRYQIDSMESQLRTFDNQINYSTVSIYIMEVNRLTPTEEKSTIEKISSGFTENVFKVLRACKDLAVGFLINIPIILAFALVVLFLFFVVRIIIRRGRKYFEKVNPKKKTSEKQLKVPYGQKTDELKEEKEIKS